MPKSKEPKNKLAEDSAKPSKPIGFIWSAANLLLRGIVSTAPVPVVSKKYIGEYCPDKIDIDTEHKTAPLSVKYVLQSVLRQPTASSCGDAAAMMVLKFHRDNLQNLLNEQDTLLSAASISQIQGALNVLDKFSKKIDYVSMRNEDEIKKIYGLEVIKFTASKNDAINFGKELAFHLYERGPLTATIKTRSFNISNHEIVITGVLGNNVIYADSWDGKEKEMSLMDFGKKFVDPDNTMLRICVNGYSFDLVNSLDRVERVARPGMK